MKIIQYFKLIIQFVQLPIEFKNSVFNVISSYSKLNNREKIEEYED